MKKISEEKQNSTFRCCEFSLIIHTIGLLLIAFILPLTLQAQTKVISLKVKDVSVIEALRKVNELCDNEVIFKNEEVEKETVKVTLNLKDVTVFEAVTACIINTKLQCAARGGEIVVGPSSSQRTNAPRREIRQYSGTIRDPNGEYLVGATVFVKSENKATMADIDGRFSIAATEGGVMTFSFLGYETKDIILGKDVNLDIVLAFDAQRLHDVVITTGYQTISREQITGSVATLKSEDLSLRYSDNVLNKLEGRIAGLVTYGSGSDRKTVIRGTSSLYAETSPLLVVDGLPIEGSLEDLNPYDIEDVTVLKDAAATAIYGARASNGIIVVTTKNAKAEGVEGNKKINVEVSANITIHQKKNLDYVDNFYMTPAQQVQKEREYNQYFFFDNDGEVPDPIGLTESSIYNSLVVSPIQYTYYQFAKGDISESELENRMTQFSNNNFAKEYSKHLMRSQVLQQYNVAIRSRSNVYQSNLVVNYKKHDGEMKSNTNHQFNLFYKGIYDMAPWLTIDFGINTILSKSSQNNSGFVASYFGIPAYYSMFNSDGSHAYYSPDPMYFNNYMTRIKDEKGLNSMHFNHIEESKLDMLKTDNSHTRFNGGMLFKVIEGLTLQGQFIYETGNYTTKSHAEENSYIMRLMRNAYTTKDAEGNYNYLLPGAGGKLATVNLKSDDWTARGQLNFKRTFGDHAIDFLIGTEFRESRLRGTKGLHLGYMDQMQIDATSSVDFPALLATESSTLIAMDYPVKEAIYDQYIAEAMGIETETRHRYASGYGNLTYTYKHKYNILGSVRKDYADMYGLDAKYRGQPLWSVGASWNIQNEDFMQNIKWINYLKLRASYGVTGNIYNQATSYLTAKANGYNRYTGLPFAGILSPANPNLKWETTSTTNIGLDFSLLQNRLNGSIDWYHKKGDNIFSRKSLDPSTGFKSVYMNMASLKNNGIELSLSYKWFNAAGRDKFKWNTTLTASYNKNEITNIEIQANKASDLVSSKYQIGYPTSALFSYRFAGINEKGEPTWYDSEDEATTNAHNANINALVFSGQADPKTTIGLDNFFSYKGISLSMLMVYYGGHKMRVLQAKPLGNSEFGPLPSYILNSWTPENTETNVPGYGRYSPTSISSETTFTDIYVQPADFIKIRNIALAYTLPDNVVSKIGLRNFTVRFQVDNPKALWVKNDVNIDPETQSIRIPTSFIMGVNFNF